MERKEYPFEFTVISAVYNVERFLPDFFESIISQTVGFEKIQLIMIDDYSPDGSGKVCDEYAKRYPESITVIHNEKNMGAAASRTIGIKHATGKYVTFTDPDDTLSLDTMELVSSFFERYGDGVKIAAIPIHLFGTAEGPHHLNSKFEQGERVINVFKEGEHVYPQLSISSAFIKNEVASTVSFDPSLKIAEDAEQLTKLLIDHRCLGVVPSARYNYRRYETSQIASSRSNPAWYIPYLEHFSLEVMRYAEEKLGYIPRFVKYSVMFDLQWKFAPRDEPKILSEEERDKFFELIFKCTSLIDDDIIMAQRPLGIWEKLWILSKKHGDGFSVSRTDCDLIYGTAEHAVRFSEFETRLLRLIDDGESIRIALRRYYSALGERPEAVYLTVGGETVEGVGEEEADETLSLGKLLSRSITKEFTIPKSLLPKKGCNIEIHTRIAGTDIPSAALVSGTVFPIASSLPDSYARVGGYLFSLSEHGLTLTPNSFFNRHRAERRLIRSLLKSNEQGAKKAIIARALLPILRLFKRKPIWIISDRRNKAGDNGEAFFRYLKSIDYKKATYYFAIDGCADRERLRSLGGVIERSDRRYKFIHLLADKIISSHADIFVTNPFGMLNAPYVDILNMQDFIFLQHGVTKDNISAWLDGYEKNIRGFITSAVGEYESIIKTPSYHYTEREVWLTGLPRFDRLYRDEKRYITVIPTWRKYLMGQLDLSTGIWSGSSAFKSSEYFKFYNALLNDGRLLDCAERHGYTVCYMPHPNVITAIDLFDHDPRVKFFSINDDYSRLYAESDLMLTDYSSAIFDFAYLKKPVLYTQFDREEFFSGDHVYTKGYFDYERDGFGEVCPDYESTVKALMDYIEGGCVLKDKYRDRIERFFAFGDQGCCERILKKIEET